MTKTSIDCVVVGSILAEPVIIGDVLLCKAGVPINAQLKNTLPKFGITEVAIESSPSDVLLEDFTDLSCISKTTYAKLLDLDISDIIKCANKIVDNLTDADASNDVMHMLLDYDENTFQHSVNVAYLAVIVGIKLHLTSKQLQDLALGALLHDIGKLKIPHDILCKPAALDDIEYAIIKQHPYQGLCLLQQNKKINSSVLQIVLQHHENFDGTGYPRHLKGEHSYLLARIVHICDVYEALCSQRAYKSALSRRLVRDKMMSGANTQFDPKLLKAFLEAVPLYLPGELVNIGKKVGIVKDVTDAMNPLIIYNNDVMPLTSFELLCSECA